MAPARDGKSHIGTIGEHLRSQYLEPLGMGCEELASDLGVNAQEIKNVVHDGMDLPPWLATRLDEHYGQSDGFWARLQQVCNGTFTGATPNQR